MKKIIIVLLLLGFFCLNLLLIKYYFLDIDTSEVVVEYQKSNNINKKYDNISNYSNIVYVIENNNIEERKDFITKNIRLLVSNVTNKKCELTIIDNNLETVNWDYEYEIEIFKNNNWDILEKKDILKYKGSFQFEKIKSLSYELEFIKEYGILENGIYRIRKIVTDGNMNKIIVYSNIFEIKGGEI